MVDNIKFKALSEKVAPIIEAAHKALKDMNIDRVSIVVSKDGTATLYEDTHELAPVLVRTREGKYVIRFVSEEEVATGKEKLPWD